MEENQRSRKRKGSRQQTQEQHCASVGRRRERTVTVKGGGGRGQEMNRQVRWNSLGGVTDLANSCNRSLEGNCQQGLPEVFLRFYLQPAMWFKWFYVTI